MAELFPLGVRASAGSLRAPEYPLRVESPAGEREVAEPVRVVDEVAEIPRAVRAGARVTRTS